MTASKNRLSVLCKFTLSLYLNGFLFANVFFVSSAWSNQNQECKGEPQFDSLQSIKNWASGIGKVQTENFCNLFKKDLEVSQWKGYTESVASCFCGGVHGGASVLRSGAESIVGLGKWGYKQEELYRQDWKKAWTLTQKDLNHIYVDGTQGLWSLLSHPKQNLDQIKLKLKKNWKHYQGLSPQNQSAVACDLLTEYVGIPGALMWKATKVKAALKSRSLAKKREWFEKNVKVLDEKPKVMSVPSSVKPIEVTSKVEPLKKGTAQTPSVSLPAVKDPIEKAGVKTGFSKRPKDLEIPLFVTEDPDKLQKLENMVMGKTPFKQSQFDLPFFETPKGTDYLGTYLEPKFGDRIYFGGLIKDRESYVQKLGQFYEGLLNEGQSFKSVLPSSN